MKQFIVKVFNLLYCKLRDFSNYSLMFGARKENRYMLKFLSEYKIKPTDHILDVGCGYGRNLLLLKEKGYDPIGVDINEDIVNHNKSKGLKCFTMTKLNELNVQFDAIIISHVIEHLQPSDLLNFLNYYISRLKTGGLIIIASPFPTKQFYFDFDHIRPYFPQSLNMVFTKNIQIQYSGGVVMDLLDTRMIRTPFTHRTISFSTYFLEDFLKFILDAFLYFFYYCSAGLFGLNSNWMSIYQKKP